MNKSLSLLTEIENFLEEIATFGEKLKELEKYYLDNAIKPIEKTINELQSLNYKPEKRRRFGNIIYNAETGLIDALPKIKLGTTDIALIEHRTDHKEKYILTWESLSGDLSIWDIFHSGNEDEILQIIFAQDNRDQILIDIYDYLQIYIRNVNRLIRHLKYFVINRLKAQAIVEKL